MEAADVARLLAEPDRLAVFAAAALGARDLAAVAAATGLAPAAAAKALGKLQDGGLLDGCAVRVEAIKAAARAAAAPRPVEDHGYADPATEAVVRTFVQDGRLTGFPAHAGKRRTVLEHVAQTFTPGVRYSEKEVNALLRAWTAGTPTDHATLRRYLVDHNLLTRDTTAYWRSGAWVDVDHPGPE
ncbi:DUF2087 domain-containing protein [Actinokineospora bangkokensis]|uniref:DUF2087 domain-containing protein n=1 Tax=Actinokineospora bangkokensis TaxID=1193682 RepID=A0A1Q9LDZ6_9PSEU|nr:DUF2087 domain-containing protein [Actinokineospora bangkokensis]OLR90236.1 hypothetical protein BJP25_04595 [Actinokineospora bangkokensis]